jgi:hypothetical protein
MSASVSSLSMPGRSHPALTSSSFWGFASQTIADVVFVEGLTGDLYLDGPAEVEVYNLTFRALSELAGTTDLARAKISTMIDAYQADIA